MWVPILAAVERMIVSAASRTVVVTEDGGAVSAGG
jgi:hypothetical protein